MENNRVSIEMTEEKAIEYFNLKNIMIGLLAEVKQLREDKNVRLSIDVNFHKTKLVENWDNRKKPENTKPITIVCDKENVVEAINKSLWNDIKAIEVLTSEIRETNSKLDKLPSFIRTIYKL
jgi:hypothetical protein